MDDKSAIELISVLKNIEKELRSLNARMTKLVNAQETVAQFTQHSPYRESRREPDPLDLIRRRREREP